MHKKVHVGARNRGYKMILQRTPLSQVRENVQKFQASCNCYSKKLMTVDLPSKQMHGRTFFLYML